MQGGFDFCLVLLGGFAVFYVFFNNAVARTKTVILQVCITHQITGEKIHSGEEKKANLGHSSHLGS